MRVHGVGIEPLGILEHAHPVFFDRVEASPFVAANITAGRDPNQHSRVHGLVEFNVVTTKEQLLAPAHYLY